jgi:hypothetical protein
VRNPFPRRGDPIPRLAAWFFGLYVLFGLGIWNGAEAVLRFSSIRANYHAFTVVLCLPLAMVWIAFLYPRWRDRIAVGLTCIPALLVSTLLGLFHFLPFSLPERIQLEPVDHGRVALYRIGRGALGTDVLFVQHEVEILPGVLLVRRILQLNSDCEAKIEVLEGSRVELWATACVNDTRTEGTATVLPWVYF